MSGIGVGGGCDLPESLWDGVYEVATKVTWTSQSSRSIVILTDAPFHGDEKSDHSKLEVTAYLVANGINMTIINVALAY